MERVLEVWDWHSRGVIECLSLEVLKNHHAFTCLSCLCAVGEASWGGDGGSLVFIFLSCSAGEHWDCNAMVSPNSNRQLTARQRQGNAVSLSLHCLLMLCSLHLLSADLPCIFPLLALNRKILLAIFLQQLLYLVVEGTGRHVYCGCLSSLSTVYFIRTLMWHALPDANVSIWLASLASFSCVATILLRTWLCKQYCQPASHLSV